MIFAAGLGTRLKPLTDSMPKALVPVGGKPLLEHVLLKLRNSGINEAVINVHHFADQIEDWIAAQDWLSLQDSPKSMETGQKEGNRQIMTIHISDERSLLLETGGGILHARPYLEGCGQFLVHNVDILSDADLAAFAKEAVPDAIATLLVSDRPSRRHFLFEKETMRLVGWNDDSTRRVIMSDDSVSEEDCIPYAFSGIHILSDKVFDIMQEYVDKNNIPNDGAGARFAIRDFYLDAARRHPIYGVVRKGLRLMDVGKADTLAKAEEFLLGL
ncbi:MAG: sugar phosphate nucleotidyltransferase [Candidatus Cryptobacteroides sp.]